MPFPPITTSSLMPSSLRSRSLLFPSALLVALLFGCGGGDSSSAREGGAGSPGTNAGFLLEDPPAEAPGIYEAVRNAAPGDPIVATGRIGGIKEPLSSEFAGFVLTDERVAFCDETGDLGCPTPWDGCCEDPRKLAESRFFVFFFGDDGEPLTTDLRRELGLAANQRVLVQGRLVGPTSDGPPMVQADGLHLLPAGG